LNDPTSIIIEYIGAATILEVPSILTTPDADIGKRLGFGAG